jgi:hypothetical protein
MNLRILARIALPLVLLTATPKKTFDLIAKPFPQCEDIVTCPDHNAMSKFDLTTKQVWNSHRSKYCTYGEYSHYAPPDNEHKSQWVHKFWESCGCD